MAEAGEKKPILIIAVVVIVVALVAIFMSSRGGDEATVTETEQQLQPLTPETAGSLIPPSGSTQPGGPMTPLEGPAAPDGN